MARLRSRRGLRAVRAIGAIVLAIGMVLVLGMAPMDATMSGAPGLLGNLRTTLLLAGVAFAWPWWFVRRAPPRVPRATVAPRA